MKPTHEAIWNEFLSHPDSFPDSTRSYELLNAFLEGMPTEHLRSLVASEHLRIARLGAWIASELGSRGCDVFELMIPMLESSDTYLTYHASEVAAICGADRREVQKAYAKLLVDPRPALARLIMKLLTFMSDSSFAAFQEHAATLDRPQLFRRRLHAVRAMRAANQHPEELDQVDFDDPDIAAFVTSMIQYYDLQQSTRSSSQRST